MSTTLKRNSLEAHLRVQYPFHVVVDPDGGYVIAYPDLPGCTTQVDDASEIAEMAEDARRLWIETEYERGADIPPPSYPEEYSGKFNLRIPRSLHRSLATNAGREGVSLNQYVLTLLARGDAQTQIGRSIEEAKNEIVADIRLSQQTGKALAR